MIIDFIKIFFNKMNIINMYNYTPIDPKNSTIKKIIDRDNIEYKINSLLGKGQFGEVFKATTNIGRKVAIKILNKSEFTSKFFNAYDDRGVNYNLKQTQNEIDVHLELKHRHIINLEKFFQDESRVFMVLELSLTSLDKIIHVYKNIIDENGIKRIINKIVNGLMYLKENLIIHRDIKPANILVTEDSDIKISDFGECIKLNNINEIVNERCGSPIYMSCQIVSKQDYSFETDVWSLGVLFYELLFKKLPFVASYTEDLYDLIKDSTVIYPEESNLTILISKMLEKNILDRISLNGISTELTY